MGTIIDKQELTSEELNVITTVALKVLQAMHWNHEDCCFYDEGNFTLKMSAEQFEMLHKGTRKLIDKI